MKKIIRENAKMSQKDQFINYLKDKSPEKSGKPSAYAKAMEVIEDVLFAPSFAHNRGRTTV